MSDAWGTSVQDGDGGLGKSVVLLVCIANRVRMGR